VAEPDEGDWSGDEGGAEGEEGERTGRRKEASKKWPIVPKANEPDEGENEPLKLRKTAAEKPFVFWYATPRLSSTKVSNLMFRNETVRT
jgi:hypothetical protein